MTKATKSRAARRSVREPGAVAKPATPRARSEVHPRAVMVLGMHRSGTSALTRVINLLGADLPKSLLAPRPDNEAGFWESSDLANLHDELLSSGGSNWHDWRAFNPDWYESPAAPAFRNRVLNVLRNDCAGSQLFVIKDPRICRFWPFWSAVLDEFGVRPAVVIALRNPLEVTASLGRRNRFIPAKSGLLWLRHMIDAEKATRDLPRAVVTYDALLSDWRGLVADLGTQIGVRWPRRSAVGDVEIDQFLSIQLRHHVVAPEQLNARAELVDWIKDAYAALVQLSKIPGHKASMARLDRIAAAFDKASSVFGTALVESETELATREMENARLALEVRLRSEAAESVTHLKAALEVANATILEERHKLTNQADSFIDLLEHQRDSDAGRIGAIAELQKFRNESDRRIFELTEEAARLRADSETRATEHTERLAEFEQRHSEAEARHAEAANEARQFVSERDILRQRISDLADEHELLRTEASIATAKLKDELNRTFAALSAERQHAAEQADRIAELEQRHRDIETRHVVDANEARQLTSERDSLRDRIAELEQRSESAEAEHAAVVRQLCLERHPLRERISGHLNDQAGMHADAVTLKEKLEQTLTELSAERQQTAEQADRLAELEERQKVAAAHYAAVSAAVGELTSDREALRQQISDLLDQHARLQDQAAESSAERALYAKALADARTDHHSTTTTLRMQLIDTQAALSKSTAENTRTGVWTALLPASIHGRRLRRRIQRSALFDIEWYNARYPDVSEAGFDAIDHYLTIGFCRGYLPNPFFDTRWYLAQYEDVRLSGTNPLYHYLTSGHLEDRNPGPHFETAYYLHTNPDVRTSGMNPLAHYLHRGRHEGRLPTKRAETLNYSIDLSLVVPRHSYRKPGADD